MHSPATTTQIRPARRGDLDALLALEQSSFPGDRLSRAQYLRHINSASARVLVAVQETRLLGSAVLLFRRGTQVTRVHSLAVAADAWGQGIGRALLNAAEQTAQGRACTRMRLEVRSDNLAAIALYQRAGYVRSGQRQDYYQDGADAWVYDKPV